MSSTDQDALSANMVKIGDYLADKGWLSDSSPVRARALADEKKKDPIRSLKQRLADGEDFAGSDFDAGAVREGVEQFGEMVQKVDFPKFVSGLIKGVFQAVVDASIQQMRAFGELLAATAKTVEQFAADHISDAEARDHVANRYPSAVRVDTSTDGPARLRPSLNDDDDGSTVAEDYGLDSLDLDDDESEQKLVGAAKLEMARSRQQLMATMVLLGINRIVVTNGRINAKVVFDMRASDEAKRRSRASLHDKRMEANASTSGFALPFFAGGSFSADAHETTVTSSIDDTSESKAEVKAQLSGDVRLSFKSETFPLERMVDVMGLEKLNEKAGPTGL